MVNKNEKPSGDSTHIVGLRASSWKTVVVSGLSVLVSGYLWGVEWYLRSGQSIFKTIQSQNLQQYHSDGVSTAKTQIYLNYSSLILEKLFVQQMLNRLCSI